MAAAAKHIVVAASILVLAESTLELAVLAESTLVLAESTLVLHMHRCLAREGSALAVLVVQVVQVASGTRRSCLHTAHSQVYAAGDNILIQASCGSRKGTPVLVRCKVQKIFLAEKSIGE